MRYLFSLICSIFFALGAQQSVAQSIELPSHLIAKKLGPSCARYYSPSRLTNDLRYVSELKGVSMTSTNSLTVNHDAISKRWVRLLSVSMGAAARNDAAGARRIIDTLVGLANSRTMLDVMSVSKAKRVNCWAEGSKNAVCPYHVVQHSGYSAIAMMMSASMLEEYMSGDERALLSNSFKALYEKFVSPLSTNGAKSDGLYEFADYGIGVLAYAR